MAFQARGPTAAASAPVTTTAQVRPRGTAVNAAAIVADSAAP
ncbi:hypothetical protein [Streptomyces sp. NPDC052107]